MSGMSRRIESAPAVGRWFKFPNRWPVSMMESTVSERRDFDGIKGLVECGFLCSA